MLRPGIDEPYVLDNGRVDSLFEDNKKTLLHKPTACHLSGIRNIRIPHFVAHFRFQAPKAEANRFAGTIRVTESLHFSFANAWTVKLLFHPCALFGTAWCEWMIVPQVVIRDGSGAIFS